MGIIDILIRGRFPNRRTFGQIAGIDEGQLSRINKSGHLGSKTAQKMARHLGMTPGQLIDFAIQDQGKRLDESA